LKNPSILDRGRKGIIYIIESHKKELLFGILLLIFVVGIAAAAVYNSMYMQSEIGVEIS
jgi:hypothetical protein